MARVCQITGKAPMVGHNVSHANNKTKRRFLPNLQRRRFWLEGENRWITLRLTNAARRTIDNNGIEAVLADVRARGEYVCTLTGAHQARKDQARIFGRPRPRLHDDEEQEAYAGEDGDQEVRSRRAQARHLQRAQDQVSLAPAGAVT